MFRLNNETQIPEIGLGVYKMKAGKEMNDAVKYIRIKVRFHSYIVYRDQTQKRWRQ